MTNVASKGQLFTAPVSSDISKITNTGLRPRTSSITRGRGANQPAGAPSGRDGSGAGSPWTPSFTCGPLLLHLRPQKSTPHRWGSTGAVPFSQTAPFLHESPTQLPACSLASSAVAIRMSEHHCLVWEELPAWGWTRWFMAWVHKSLFPYWWRLGTTTYLPPAKSYVLARPKCLIVDWIWHFPWIGAYWRDIGSVLPAQSYIHGTDE